MGAEILCLHMDVRSGRKHPKAKHHRQQDGQPSLPAMGQKV
jgi:hypothetical protein